MTNLLLGGQVDDRDQQIQMLQDENEQLRQINLDLESEVRQAKAQNVRAVAALRGQLTPLYRALQMVFGQMDEVSPEGAAAPVQSNAKWDVIKQRLAPRLREAIDILLIQKSMKRTQIASALKMDYSNCTKNVISVLMRQGLIVESGGNLSLKEL